MFMRGRKCISWVNEKSITGEIPVLDKTVTEQSMAMKWETREEWDWKMSVRETKSEVGGTDAKRTIKRGLVV